jgi:hypothetical protein
VTQAAPRYSIVLDLGAGDPEQVRRSLSSLAQQDLRSWELLLHGEAAEEVAHGAAAPHVRVVAGSGSASERVQRALRHAKGEFTGFMTAGEELAGRDVLARFDAVVSASSDVDLLYGDHDVVDEEGVRRETLPKPAWSPERLLAQQWVGRPAMLRTSVVLDTLADDPLLEAWEWDLLLRMSGRLRRVERIPEVLLHARGPGDEGAVADGVSAVRRHLERSGVSAEVTAGSAETPSLVRRLIPEELSVTLVVPSRGERGLAWGERRSYVVEAVRSFLGNAGHPRLEVVVVHSSSVEHPVLDTLLAHGETVRLVPYDGPFCAPDMANVGVLSSAGDVVIVMDERTEVVSDQFVPTLVGPLADEGVGLTGPRMLAPNGTLVDAGLAFAKRRFEHAFEGWPADDPGPAGLLTISHECSGLGHGCLAMRRDTFELAGGFNPRLDMSYNVDLSFKMRHLGRRRVWVPQATAYLLGSARRSLPPPKAERVALRKRWATQSRDEYVPCSGA